MEWNNSATASRRSRDPAALDPERVLRGKIVEFVQNGDFGLASGRNADGSYDRVWLQQILAPEEVAFEANVFLLKKAVAQALQTAGGEAPSGIVPPPEGPSKGEAAEVSPAATPASDAAIGQRTVRLRGSIPPEVWNRFGTKVLPKMRAGKDLNVNVDLSSRVELANAMQLESDLRQALEDVGLSDAVQIEGD